MWTTLCKDDVNLFKFINLCDLLSARIKFIEWLNTDVYLPNTSIVPFWGHNISKAAVGLYQR
jgi:hypothetical protein